MCLTYISKHLSVNKQKKKMASHHPSVTRATIERYDVDNSENITLVDITKGTTPDQINILLAFFGPFCSPYSPNATFQRMLKIDASSSSSSEESTDKSDFRVNPRQLNELSATNVRRFFMIKNANNVVLFSATDTTIYDVSADIPDAVSYTARSQYLKDDRTYAVIYFPSRDSDGTVIVMIFALF